MPTPIPTHTCDYDAFTPLPALDVAEALHSIPSQDVRRMSLQESLLIWHRRCKLSVGYLQLLMHYVRF